MSVYGRWHFAFWEREMLRRFRLLCAPLASLIFSGLLAAQSNDLADPHLGGGGTAFVMGR